MPVHGFWEIEGVQICQAYTICFPCPQVVQQICMKCFNRLGIGREYIAGSHFPDVRRKVIELDPSVPQRNWEWLVNATEEQFNALATHTGEILRRA